MDANILTLLVHRVKPMFEGDTSGHDWSHIQRVTASAMQMAQLYFGGETNGHHRQMVLVSALMHDVGDKKLFQQGPEVMIPEAMAGMANDQEIETVVKIVNSVSWSKGGKAETLEAQIVQDADRLDAIGHIGIARAFQYAGSKGQPMESALQHFDDKLLHVSDRLNTGWAREEGARRHAQMVQFLRGIKGF